MRKAVILSILVATSCCVTLLLTEHDYGVTRSAPLNAFPDTGCVRTVVAGLDGVQRVSESSQQDHDRLSYSGSGFSVNAYVTRDPQGKVLFSQDSITVNRRPSAREVESTRRMMRMLERRLASECGLRELVNDVHEACIRVHCPSGDQADAVQPL